MEERKKSRIRWQNNDRAFSYTDRLIIKKLIKVLSITERKAIHQRYWQKYLIADIARESKKPWDWAFHLLNTAHFKMRHKLCSDAQFMKWRHTAKYLEKLKHQ